MEKGNRRTHSVFSAIRHYPVPFISLAGIAIGSILYLFLEDRQIGENVWYLTLIVGGVPLLYGTVLKMIRGRFAVDIIAVFAVVTAVIMDQSFAGAVIVLMQSGGEALEKYGMARATSDMSRLLERSPKVAHLKFDGTIRDIQAEEVKVGDSLLVKQGDLFPVDGKITYGESEIDESSLTGEAQLIHKRHGDSVLSGTVNVSYPLEIVASHTSRDSQYSRIVDLVKRAQADRAPIMRIADRYGTWLIPLTLITAFAGWMITGNPVTILSVFVVATPCPLILATPIAMMGGLSKATKKGIIVKGGSAIEALGRADEVFFDKTGTLTRGKPEVQEIITLQGYQEDSVLRIIGIAEQFSTHPVATEITSRATGKFGKLPLPEDFKEIPGRGVVARVEGKQVVIGTHSLCNEYITPDSQMNSNGILSKITTEAAMSSCVAIDGTLVGIVVFNDNVRPGVKEMAEKLKGMGIEDIRMLTGDNQRNAGKIASSAGISGYEAELKPQDKLNFITNEMNKGKSVVMVGDGINDAPALATATVGIAMGATGSDISAETSDVILTVDDVTKAGEAIAIGKRTLKIAKQSILVGIGLSAVFMGLSVFGFIQPSEGAIIQEIVDAISIFNSMRARL